jgi:preprotein translocase subunit SecB
MSDEEQTARPPIQVNAQYIKDLSFEVPGAPMIFTELSGAGPEISVRVDLNAESLQPEVYEVTLKLSVEATVTGKKAFIVDLTYGGVFTLVVPEEHIQPVLFIECPRLLFPFARAIVADVTKDGGFPPLMLQPVDFVSLFRNRMDYLAAQQAGGTA